MSEIDLTDEDMSMIYGQSAISVFLATVAVSLQGLAEHPGGATLQDFLLKGLQENLKRALSPNAPYPMEQKERELLAQYYRVFLGFYRDPNSLVNLPTDSPQ